MRRAGRLVAVGGRADERRSYLSIGDVLTLLRQEFPDVTISKIRFLESQGLVNPERTPSGYRKFYEHDVERLRWVLRQQREHFLPLKVIKDRLDDDPDGVGRPADDRPAAAGRSPTPADGRGAVEPAQSGRRDGGPPRRRAGAASGTGARRTRRAADGSPTRARHRRCGDHGWPAMVDHARHRVPLDGRRRGHRGVRTGGGARAPSAPNVAAAGAVRPTGAGHRRRPPSAPAPAAPADRRRGQAVRGRRPRHGPAAGDAATPAEPPDPPARAGRRPGRARSAAPARAAGAGAGRRHRPTSAGPASRLDELAAAAASTSRCSSSSQEYGLLAPTMVAGLEYFDEEALAVATVAARFARFGIEPRHLRLYKNAADREAGFVEQIVLPLVRQRNPEARARAHETAEELAHLGQQLRSSLLRGALRDLLDG